MKKFVFIIAVLGAVFFSTPDHVYTFSTGAPAGKTGSPGDDGVSCNSTYCHSGPAPVSGEFIDILVTQPLNQGTYRIVVEVSNTGSMAYEKAGFQACVEDNSGNKIGQLSIVDPMLTKFPNGNNDYVTHTFSGTAISDLSVNSNHLWEFDWIPPSNFDGQEAIVYVAAILSNNNNSNSGDIHITNNYAFNVGVSITEPAFIDVSFYPNPAKDKLYVSFDALFGEHVIVRLFDIKGAELSLFDGVIEQEEYIFSLPPDIKMGIYTLEVETFYGRSSQLMAIQ